MSAEEGFTMVHWPHAPADGSSGHAYVVSGETTGFYQSLYLRAHIGPVPIEGWVPPTFEVRDGKAEAYQSNITAMRLCSAGMREVLDRNRTPADELQWLPASVIDEHGQPKPYFVLHFPTPLDQSPNARPRRVLPHLYGGLTLFLVANDIVCQLVDVGCRKEIFTS